MGTEKELELKVREQIEKAKHSSRALGALHGYDASSHTAGVVEAERKRCDVQVQQAREQATQESKQQTQDEVDKINYKLWLCRMVGNLVLLALFLYLLNWLNNREREKERERRREARKRTKQY